MQILPVLDIQNGIAVHAIAGNRNRYRRIHSQLTESCDPSVLLRQFELLGCRACYIADLDAIAGRSLNRCTLAELTRSDNKLHIDAGIRSRADVEALLDLDVHRVIVALETLPGPAAAAALVQEFGDRLTVSLDLRDGRVVSPWQPWTEVSAELVAQELLEPGFSSIIVLDVATVGTARGPACLELCRTIRKQHPHVHLATGGGVRSVADLQVLHAAGVDSALVATALHDGRLTAADVMHFVPS